MPTAKGGYTLSPRKNSGRLRVSNINRDDKPGSGGARSRRVKQ